VQRGRSGNSLMGWNINRALRGTTGTPYQSVQGTKYFCAPGRDQSMAIIMPLVFLNLIVSRDRLAPAG
jgi:hypothetical protein